MHLDGLELSNVEVVDVNGRIVFQGMIDNSAQLDVSAWAEGVYLLRVTDSPVQSSFRIMVMH